MLGGGIWITQNKVLPGSYINFVNTNTGGALFGERGIVAIVLPLGATNAGKVITCEVNDFIQKPNEILGANVPENSMKALREIFKHANTVHVFNSYSDDTAPTVGTACAALEPYDFNIIAAYTSEKTDIDTYISQVKTWRDNYGKKCQLVVYNAEDPDHEGVINVVSTVSDEGADAHALVAWVAGAEAGCDVNASCTNKKYDGEYTVNVNKTQSELEACITGGQIAFHLVYGDVRVLEDINSLTTTTAEKGIDFMSNQTIRICDQIANDIAKLFNTRYLGIVPNDRAGRASLWGDIVKHHRNLETLRAIQDYDPSLLTVEQGDTKKSVVITDVINPVNAMAQLYMTVVVQ